MYVEGGNWLKLYVPREVLVTARVTPFCAL